MASRDLSTGLSLESEPLSQSASVGLFSAVKLEKLEDSSQVGTSSRISSPYQQAFSFKGSQSIDTSSATPVYFDSIETDIDLSKKNTFNVVTYSDSFLKIKTAQFVSEFKNGVQIWIKVLHKTSELKEVRTLFNLIENYSKFLDSRSENRVMLGSVQNFLSKWSTYNQKNLEHLITLLENFKDGEIELKKLKTFTSEVFVLINSNGQKEKEI